MQQSLLWYNGFLGRLLNYKPLHETHLESKNPMSTRCNTTEALQIVQLSGIPPTG